VDATDAPSLRMGGEAIERGGLAGESKEMTVLPLREDERRPSWLFASRKVRGE
jgi:ribosome modulation factor